MADHIFVMKNELLSIDLKPLLDNLRSISNDSNLGWVLQKKDNKAAITGTYLHGILENGKWRRRWINLLRNKKGLCELPINEPNHSKRREKILDSLTDEFEKNIDLFKMKDI